MSVDEIENNKEIEKDEPQFDPEDCENCVADAEDSGFEYTQEFTWENGAWVCDQCGAVQ